MASIRGSKGEVRSMRRKKMIAGTKTFNSFRRISLLFFPDCEISKMVAPPTLTPEDYLIKCAGEEVKKELLKETLKCAKDFLTQQQQVILGGVIEGKTYFQIAEDLGYKNPSFGNSRVFGGLKGWINYRNGKRTKEERVGGIFKILHRRLKKRPKICKLLDIISELNKNNVAVARTYLCSRDSFWETFNEEKQDEFFKR